MANQNAIQDDNQFPALIGHSGTAGTAEARRIVVSTSGAISVDVGAGSINTDNPDNLIKKDYDYIGVSEPDGTTVLYVHKIGGASGTVVGTISVFYSDTTYGSISSIYAQNV